MAEASGKDYDKFHAVSGKNEGIGIWTGLCLKCPNQFQSGDGKRKDQ